ncbi:MAG: hypothetical protein JWO38_6948 [Gemmataceae bacterium]|nr:hypothetical protein [Gemmataceae bacterium]
MGGPVVLLVCCFLLVLLVPVVLFLLTYIFRLACVLCGLPKPSILAAAGIMSVNFVADAIALTVLEEVVWLGAQGVGVPRWESWIVTRFLDLPVDLAISSGLHAGLMGIKFGKGLEVWFVQRLIQLSIVAAVVFVGVLVYLIQAN